MAAKWNWSFSFLNDKTTDCCVLFLDRGRGWARKLKLVWSSFVFSLEILFPLYYFGPAQKTTSSQIAFRAFTLYELNVCAVYMQACAKWIKNGNKNEKQQESCVVHFYKKNVCVSEDGG